MGHRASSYVQYLFSVLSNMFMFYFCIQFLVAFFLFLHTFNLFLLLSILICFSTNTFAEYFWLKIRIRE